MKFFIATIALCLAVSVYALTDEQKEKLKAHSEHCKTESSVKPEFIEKLKTEKVLVEGDEGMNKYCDCMLKKIHFMHDDGTIDAALIKTKIPADVDQTKAVPHVDKCAGIKDGANTGCKVIKCLAEHKYKITTLPA